MNIDYFIRALIPVGIALVTVLLCRSILLRRGVTVFLAVFGFLCILVQSGVVSRADFPMDSPSLEYREGFRNVALIVQNQRPMLYFIFLAMFILAMFPPKKRRIHHEESAKEQEYPPNQNSKSL